MRRRTGRRCTPDLASSARRRCESPSLTNRRTPFVPEENGPSTETPVRSRRARKPSYTTLIYEARNRLVFPMTTAYDVPPGLLIERLKDRLQAEGKIKPPEWAPFARTGVNTEKAPVQKDWWYRRGAPPVGQGHPHRPGRGAPPPPPRRRGRGDAPRPSRSNSTGIRSRRSGSSSCGRS